MYTSVTTQLSSKRQRTKSAKNLSLGDENTKPSTPNHTAAAMSDKQVTDAEEQKSGEEQNCVIA